MWCAKFIHQPHARRSDHAIANRDSYHLADADYPADSETQPDTPTEPNSNACGYAGSYGDCYGHPICSVYP